MQDKYTITIEFTPDLTADPDAYRLHNVRKHEVPATEEVMSLVRAFERALDKAANAAGGEG